MTTTTVEAPAVTRAPVDRVAAWAGIGFVVSLVAQNVLRGSFAPLNDATGADVIAYVTDHAWVIRVTGLLVALNYPLIAIFVAGLFRRTWQGRSVPAVVGLAGGAGILSLFPLTVAVEAVLAARGDALSPDIAELMWTLHNAVFVMTLLTVAVAVGGFAVAAVEEGLVPNLFRLLGPAGAALMILTTAFALDAVTGSPIFYLGLLGFLVWPLFMVTAGMGMLRGR